MNRRRISHRRIILGLLGAPFIALGIAILKQGRLAEPLAPSVSLIANNLFGWLWIIVGSFAIVVMIASETRAVIEEVGYGLLIIPPLLWMGAYFVSLIYSGGFFVFVGFVIATTIVVLILYLARFMRNG